MTQALDEALSRLKDDPEHPVTAEVDGLVLEIRVRKERSAAEVLEAVGPWEGESVEELMELLRSARKEGGTKRPPDPF